MTSVVDNGVSPKADTQDSSEVQADQRPADEVQNDLKDEKNPNLEEDKQDPEIADEPEKASEDPVTDQSESKEISKEDTKNPDPFEQEEVIEDYPMDTLYNKKRVPYIEKNNGTIMLTKHNNYAKAIEYYNKALFAIKILIEDQNIASNIYERQSEVEIAENLSPGLDTDGKPKKMNYVEKVIYEVEIPISSNLTLCYLKEKDYQNVIKYADKLIQCDPNVAKIFYRRGMAYANLMEFDKAKEDLMEANRLCPNDKTILQGFKVFKQKKYEYKYKTQKICQNIFDKQNEELYPEAVKDEETEDQKASNEEVKLEQGTIPYYIGKTFEVAFAIPLVVYKSCLERPTVKILKLGDSVISLTDHIPLIGGL